MKLFETDNLLTYEEAEDFCEQQSDSHLLTVETKQKQKFVKGFLKKNEVADDVWIGLKYVGKFYQWADNSPLQYTNWADGSPKNNADYCVLMRMEHLEKGLWSDEKCTKRNAVICEKMQVLSMARLQNAVENLKNNDIFPIGFIYVQLPYEKSPQELWTGMEWEDITSAYEGLFFRAEGGGAAPFGEVQDENSPRLVAMHVARSKDSSNSIEISANNEFSSFLNIDGAATGNTDWDLEVKVSKGEVRPRNMAIKIWKKIM